MTNTKGVKNHLSSDSMTRRQRLTNWQYWIHALQNSDCTFKALSLNGHEIHLFPTEV